MIIRGMNIFLIITCIIIIFLLVIFPLIVSYRAERKKNYNEWDKIKQYGNKINKKNKNTIF